MEAQPEHPSEEIKRIQRCVNDLVSVVALPAIWSGSEPGGIVRTLIEVLPGMLRLDLIYVRLEVAAGEAPIEMARVAQTLSLPTGPQEIGELCNHWLGDDPQKWPALVRSTIGDGDMTIVPMRLGLQGEVGIIVAGSRRADFPQQTERLVLSVAANQAAVGLQEARLLSEQKRVAGELDQRVAQRTTELAAANEELTKEVAERKRAEAQRDLTIEELRRSEAFLAEAQYLSSTGSFSWRVVTDEITWSEHLYRIYELEMGASVTLELFRTRVHPEDLTLYEKMVERARNGGDDFEWQYRLMMPDHSIKYLHAVARATRDQDGQLEYIASVQDVTERRLSEEALGDLRSELAHVSRVATLGALTASIAHEVNQPLSGIITNAGTCLRMLAADPPNVEGARETARRTIRDGHRASDVITRLRALFGKKGAATESVDLNEATREVIALSSSELQRGRVLLRTELTDDLPPVNGDRVQLQQVILNLLRNASDAMNGVEDRPRQLVIRTERDEGERVRLSVRDAGVGFDPQAADRVFQAFYTTKDDGMGIGLSVSRAIIESHHGRLWATHNDGPGATFSFSIPRVSEAVTVASGVCTVPTPAVTDAERAVRDS
jgi:C4-dicarboxylate-specific signal transduction histidine kinase